MRRVEIADKCRVKRRELDWTDLTEPQPVCGCICMIFMFVCLCVFVCVCMIFMFVCLFVCVYLYDFYVRLCVWLCLSAGCTSTEEWWLILLMDKPQ